jgi:hypothetical protein
MYSYHLRVESLRMFFYYRRVVTSRRRESSGQKLLQLSAMDLLALASMKNAANRDM